MHSSSNSHLRIICHPYMFALQEGKEFQHDMLDYSLLLLQRTCTEYVKKKKNAKQALFIESRPFFLGNNK